MESRKRLMERGSEGFNVQECDDFDQLEESRVLYQGTRCVTWHERGQC